MERFTKKYNKFNSFTVLHFILFFFSWAQGIKVHMERYTPLVTFWIWLTLLETNTLHTSLQVQHTHSQNYLNSIYHHLDSSSIPSQWNCDWERYQTINYSLLNQTLGSKKLKKWSQTWKSSWFLTTFSL